MSLFKCPGHFEELIDCCPLHTTITYRHNSLIMISNPTQDLIDFLLSKGYIIYKSDDTQTLKDSCYLNYLAFLKEHPDAKKIEHLSFIFPTGNNICRKGWENDLDFLALILEQPQFEELRLMDCIISDDFMDMLKIKLTDNTNFRIIKLHKVDTYRYWDPNIKYLIKDIQKLADFNQHNYKMKTCRLFDSLYSHYMFPGHTRETVAY